MPLPDLEDMLSALLDRLDALRPGPKACFEPPLRKIAEVRDLLAVASRPNWDYLRGKLREIDDDVSAAALQALPPADADACRAEAERAIARHRGRLDDASLQDAMARYAIQRARERFGLPRVSLV
jgi:Arc/MetJ family transcription regulator